MSKEIIVILLGVFLIVSCESETKEKAENSDHDTAISLNEGQKWKVNPEMMPHISKGQEILNDYHSKEENDYKKLAQNIKEQNNALIKSCTMKGESHEELHKWLHPHIKLVEDLSKAENESKAELIISQLDDSYKTYNQYFE